MTEPRFIPAGEAKAMLEGSQEQHEWWPDVLTPVEESAHDLAHTVIHQDREITDLFQEVDDHHHDLLRVMEERNQQAEQIKRLQAGIKKLGSWPGGPMPITLIEDGIITKADME